MSRDLHCFPLEHHRLRTVSFASHYLASRVRATKVWTPKAFVDYFSSVGSCSWRSICCNSTASHIQIPGHASKRNKCSVPLWLSAQQRVGAHTGSLGKESGYRQRNEVKQNEQKEGHIESKKERKESRKIEIIKTHIITKGQVKSVFVAKAEFYVTAISVRQRVGTTDRSLIEGCFQKISRISRCESAHLTASFELAPARSEVQVASFRSRLLLFGVSSSHLGRVS